MLAGYAEYTASTAVAEDYSGLSLDELVRLCRDTGAAPAWEEFVSRTRLVVASAIRNTLRRWGLEQADSEDDLAQEVYLKISRNRAESLRNFRPAHANGVFGFLRTVATNLAHDHCRAQIAAKRGAGLQDEEINSLQAIERPDRLNGTIEIEREILLNQIDGLLRSVTSDANQNRDRFIFWMHYRHGMTATSIAALPNLRLTVKGVESTLQRLTRLIRTELVEEKMAQKERRQKSRRSIAQKAVIGE
jgi:RNA polymerase sigma-70 factor (ECF subfamily)